MSVIITNAFSLSMLDRASQDDPRTARTPRPRDDPQALLESAERHGVPVRSAVGHADTAAVLSGILGRPVAFNRETVRLGKGDVLLVGQYVGPRLAEGATELPAGARIEWWCV